MRAPLLAVLLLVLAPAVRAADSFPVPDADTTLDLAHLPDDSALAQLLWSRSPDLVPARAKVASARGDVVRAGLLPNPSLDASWNTIPVGPTNPPGLSAPLENIPNYALSVSTLVEIRKRGPRQQAARGALDAATLDAYELLRQRWYDLRERVAEVAAARERVAALTDLVTDAHRLTELQRARASRGDAAGLDADRAALDESKFQTNLSDERQKLAEAVADCARVAGVRCEPFDDVVQASAYLATGLVAPATGDLDARPDLRSLAAQEKSAQASLQLAHNRRIPDPTFRLGYVRDQFIVAGNQENSLFAGVSVPLPVFDHGQADALQAAASADAANRARSLLRAQAARDVTALAAQARDAEARRRALDDSSLPLARRLVETLDRAVQQGGASLSELLLARRTLGELLVDAADVELLSFRVASELGRAGAVGPPPPADLAAAS
jgi:cobalt-zinc-cadmium efflux system outer membrane protein